MYHVAIIGESLGAQVAALACAASGFHDIDRLQGSEHPNEQPQVYSLGANASRLLRALVPESIEELGFQPDRRQVRFAKSAYLLAELPLGEFYQQRYGSPLLNFSAPALKAHLERHIGNPLKNSMSLNDAEISHQLTVLADSERGTKASNDDPSFLIYHASLPDHPLRKANVLWRGNGQYVEQLADNDQVHFRFITRADIPFDPEQWHDSLQDAFAAKMQFGGVSLNGFTAGETLFAGRVAYLHSALTPASQIRVDADNTALEDAWVLSRMMENYEEDIADGLAAYERFRRPRHRKVMAGLRTHLATLTQTSSMKRFGQHVGTALQNRLLPEIALQRQDWLYQHDVIKGFR